MQRRRETSAQTAARFLATRERLTKLYKRPRPYRRRRPIEQVLGSGAAEMLRAAPNVPRRIACDFAEPTLRAIHKVLCDAMAPREHRPEHYTGELLNLIVIAEQMVGRALGYPDCDEPPLTDRSEP
jgi:hypothetical protein